jgi:hypothetical protein
MGLKSLEEKQDYKRTQATKQWAMINVVEVQLLLFACLDFSAQIIYQLPMFKQFQGNGKQTIVGFRKVWYLHCEHDLSFQEYVKKGVHESYEGYNIDWYNFQVQVLNCIMISIISLQSEIFRSAGYIKYVTQVDGSMDLLVKLADLKRKSFTYIFNNEKIRKILSIQRRKETIKQTVQKLKEKLARWRKFTRTTLDVREEEGRSSIAIE